MGSAENRGYGGIVTWGERRKVVKEGGLDAER